MNKQQFLIFVLITLLVLPSSKADLIDQISIIATKVTVKPGQILHDLAPLFGGAATAPALEEKARKLRAMKEI